MVTGVENDLVEALYDAALGHRSWDDVCLGLKRHVGGETLMMSVQHPKTGAVDVLGWLGMTPESLRDYPQFAPHDVWVAGVTAQRRFGNAIIGSRVVKNEELTRSFIYNEYLRPKLVPVFHLVGSVVVMDGGYQVAIGIHRPYDAKDFTAGEAMRMQRLLPHLQRALEVRQRLMQAQQASRSVYTILDRLSLGVIVLGATGRLVHVNSAADAILRRGDGLTRTPDGIRAGRKDDDKRLQELIGSLRRNRGEGRSAGAHLRIQRPSGKQGYAAMLTPFTSDALGGCREAPAVLIFVSDPGERIVSDLTVLGELFGFPPAEARLVLALLASITPPEFARQAGITYNTVRTLLARAMARTGSRSQVELVLLVAGAIGGTNQAADGAS